jgi:hypothetical protein
MKLLALWRSRLHVKRHSLCHTTCMQSPIASPSNNLHAALILKTACLLSISQNPTTHLGLL